jgi:hypothetical protein
LGDEIGGLADRTYDIRKLARIGLTNRPQLVLRSVQCRPDQIVHAGIDDHESLRSLVLFQDDARQKNARIADNDAPGLENERESEIFCRVDDRCSVVRG